MISTLSNPTTTYLANGTYNIKQVAMNLCDTIITNKNIVIANNHIFNPDKSTITISPNPGSGNEVIVKVHPNLIGKDLSINSINGHTLANEVIKNEITRLNISELIDGMYFIQVGNMHQIWIKKSN
jgi:hypothetical protein